MLNVKNMLNNFKWGLKTLLVEVNDFKSLTLQYVNQNMVLFFFFLWPKIQNVMIIYLPMKRT